MIGELISEDRAKRKSEIMAMLRDHRLPSARTVELYAELKELLGPPVRLTSLKGRHQGKVCCIVGMGPSLLDIGPHSFNAETDVIIAMNHAVIWFERLKMDPLIPVYSIQKDGYCIRPKRHPLIVHEHEGEHNLGVAMANSPDYEPRYVFSNPDDLGLEWTRPSVVTSVKIAELFGCSSVKLMACDALTTGDCRRIDFLPDGTFTILPPFPGYTAPTDKLREIEASIPMPIDWGKSL